MSIQIITVHYPNIIADTVVHLFDSLNQQYATVSLIQHDQNVLINILTHKNKVLLRKRKVYLIILVGQEQPRLPGNTLYSTVSFEIENYYKNTFQQKNVRNRYKLDGKLEIQDLSKQMVQLLQLDFIWIGFLSRLGSTVHEFAKQLTQTENFSEMEIVQEIFFIEQINKFLELGSELEQALHETQKLFKILEKQMNVMLENHVKQKFNSRFLIRHITYCEYFKLLLSRNYFNLIYIECSTLDRFKNFQLRVSQKYEHLNKILSLETFVQIDDFVLYLLFQWYSNFIQKCTPYARYTINRIKQKEPYSQVIKSSYKFILEYYSKIIRHFRPNYDEYFIQICHALKNRAGCIKQAIGAIIVKDKRIIATGYNGTPYSSINCYNGGCIVCNNSENINTEVLSCNCIHAQYSCILQAGIKITPGCTLYTTGLPCLWCTKLIIQGKIETVIYVENAYSKLKHENQDVILQTFKEAGIVLKQLKQEQKILD